MCVQQTIDGGYIITGTFGDADVYLIKTDTNGDTLWTRIVGGAYWDFGVCVQQDTSTGEFIITGGTMSYGAGGWDAYLIKMNSNGDTLWTQTFGGTELDVGYSVQQTSDGGYIVAGYTLSFGAGSYDIYLIKTDSDGDILWTETFGGTGSDMSYSVQQTTDAGYIIAGRTTSFGAGSSDVYLIKTDSTGNTQWTKTFGGTGSDMGYSVLQTTDGGYIVTGETSSYGAGSSDAYLIKTNSSGDSLWTQTYGGIWGETGISIQQTIDGGFIIAGSTMSFGTPGVENFYLIRTDSSGDTLWTQTFGGPNTNQCSSVQQTSDGGYIVTGTTRSYGAGGFDVWLIKLEPETGIEEESESTVSSVTLGSIDPNPFSVDLSITYSIPVQTMLKLTIFDLSGRLVEELVSNQIPAGTYTLLWSPSESMPNGWYLIELDACGHNAVGRCLKLN